MSDPSTPSVTPAPSLAAGGRAILWAQVAKLFLRLGSAAALARLLTPDAYGLHGMAVALYGFLYMVRDLGVFTAVQQPGLTPQRFNALCRLALAGGLALTVVCVLLGPPAAWFFDEPRVTLVLAGLAGAFVIGGFAGPPMALLYREQRIPTVMIIEVAATLVSILLAVAAAAAGWGVWALVSMAATYELTVAVAAWWRCPWPLQRDTAGTEWRKLLGLGANLTGHGIAAYFARTVDQIIAGYGHGATGLGYYGRGAQATTTTMMLAVASFNAWAIALLARCHESGAEFAATFRRLVNGVMHLVLPPAVVCLVAPDFVVRVLYGEQWLPATDVVRWLGLALVAQPLIFAQMWLLQSTAQARRLFQASALGLFAVTAAGLVAQRNGLAALAAATAAGTLVHAAVGLGLCLGRTPAHARDMLEPLTGPLLLHGGLWLALTALRAGGVGDWWLPPAAAGYYALAWLAVPAVRREWRGHFLIQA